MDWPSSYITDLCRPITSVDQQSRQILRSATRGDLVVSSSDTHPRISCGGSQGLEPLPMYMRAQETVSSFKTALKTLLMEDTLSKPSEHVRLCVEQIIVPYLGMILLNCFSRMFKIVQFYCYSFRTVKWSHIKVWWTITVHQ